MFKEHIKYAIKKNISEVCDITRKLLILSCGSAPYFCQIIKVTYQGKNVNAVTCMSRAEAEFLDVIGTKVLTVFLLAIHSHL